MGKIFAIGDIHGCLEELIKLVEKIPISSADTLVFLGDYIDRGPSSKGVIQYLIELSREYNSIFLRGNHEDMMLKALVPNAGWDEEGLWAMNGGVATIKSYGEDKCLIPKSHIEFIKSTILYHETENSIFVHAGANPAIPLDSHDPEYLMWVREPFIEDDSKWDKKVIFGHTPQRTPLILNNKIGIDTGCVFGKQLTCLELPGMVFYSVDHGINQLISSSTGCKGPHQ